MIPSRDGTKHDPTVDTITGHRVRDFEYVGIYGEIAVMAELTLVYTVQCM